MRKRQQARGAIGGQLHHGRARLGRDDDRGVDIAGTQRRQCRRRTELDQGVAVAAGGLVVEAAGLAGGEADFLGRRRVDEAQADDDDRDHHQGNRDIDLEDLTHAAPGRYDSKARRRRAAL
jgi:hypothetical protein